MATGRAVATWLGELESGRPVFAPARLGEFVSTRVNGEGRHMANWGFLPNSGREEEGLGHAGIETFKGSPYPGIARECSQNSLDAAARSPDGTPLPVKLVFRLLHVPAQDIPGLGDLKKSLHACLEQWKDQKKERDFFERAIRNAERSLIPVLSIEDYGTTGLIGPAVKGKPFHALVKSSGISQKADADAGGSFGIGKNAAFAISSLRTVFYSTIYQADDVEKSLAQGKAILVSHDDGVPKRATGYWGASEFMPVESQAQLPVWLRRTEVGTTVASVGFFEEPNWQWLMTESLIRNFFSGISNGAISFAVHWSNDDHIEINAESLEALFVREEVRGAAESSGTTEDLEFSSAMLATLRSGDAEVERSSFANAGAFRVTLLQKQGFPRRLGILRNGMYIADNLKHFGHAMARFPMSRDFVAVLEPDDRDTSGKVRDMESPRHDEISAERIDDLALKNRMKSAMKQVGDWVRSTIRASTTKPAEGEILLDEMNRFFSKPSAGPSIPDPSNTNDDPERTNLASSPNPLRPLYGEGKAGNSGSAGGLKKSKSKGGKTTGGTPGSGRGSVGGRGGKTISISELRSSGQGHVRRIAFTPNASGAGKLDISAVGVAIDEALAIKSIDGIACGKAPRIELVQDERKSIDVEFDFAFAGPIRVVLTPSDENDHAD